MLFITCWCDPKTWFSEFVNRNKLIYQSLIDTKEVLLQINNESAFQSP